MKCSIYLPGFELGGKDLVLKAVLLKGLLLDLRDLLEVTEALGIVINYIFKNCKETKNNTQRPPLVYIKVSTFIYILSWKILNILLSVKNINMPSTSKKSRQ